MYKATNFADDQLILASSNGIIELPLNMDEEKMEEEDDAVGSNESEPIVAVSADAIRGQIYFAEGNSNGVSICGGDVLDEDGCAWKMNWNQADWPVRNVKPGQSEDGNEA